MYRKNKIAVAIQAYNEEKLIGRTISTLPDFVDRIIVVDDMSKDNTLDVLVRLKKRFGKRLIVIGHKKNRGVGGAITTGYREAMMLGMDITVVMNGDNQMDPNDLPNLLDPIVEDRADYVKGNRLLHPMVKKKMPGYRYFGNSLLTFLNKIATGYWHVMDPQCGYTAISLKALKTIPIDDIYPRYGVPNDILTKLNVFNFRVKDVSVYPVYKDEKSKIKLKSYIPKVSWLLLRCFFFRLKEKYLLRDFHPLAFFYISGMIMFPLGVIYGIYIVLARIIQHKISSNAVVLSALLIIIGLQSIFFGMLFDMEYNKNISKE